MDVNYLISIAFLFAAVGQVALAVSQLGFRAKTHPVYIPLIAFFVASALSFSLPAFIELWPKLNAYGVVIALPFLLLQPAALWLYVDGLTSPVKWSLSKDKLIHVIPALIGFITSLGLLLLPGNSLEQIFIEGRDTSTVFETSLIILVFLLLIFCIAQYSVYMVAVIRRLFLYRAQLKQLFSSNETREMVWVFAIAVVITVTWLVALVYLTSSMTSEIPIYDQTWVTALYFILVWLLAVWGVRQKPGYDGRYIDSETEKEELIDVLSGQTAKYQKSALSGEQMNRIANKLEQTMKEQQLYLNADLSLQVLAKAIHVSPSYLSQTLNQQIEQTFFDYVNHWRIEFAKPLIVENKLNVLEVAMESGFNARSSFYTAFKQNTSLTPSAYRSENKH